MNTIGIICEYNPFHNGHVYHFKKIKELFPDSLIILIMNGYFLQRGEISTINKKDKTLISLEQGIDLVIELPFVFGSQSADVFASNSIKILEMLKCDYVVFGSESNDLDKLIDIAKYTINNEDEYNTRIKEYLKEGMNYPTSLAKALNTDFNFESNDLLGLSYIKTIYKNKYNIKPFTIKRTNNYLDTLSNDDIISATNIRNRLNNNENIDKYIPKTVKKYIKNISLNNIFNLLKYKIITDKDLSIYLDVDEGIENKLKKVIYNCKNINDVITLVKSKRYTYNKIQRMLIHILIGFTKKDNENIKLDYIKVLGFNKYGQKYLNSIKKTLDLPLTSVKTSKVYLYELVVSTIYDELTNENNLSFELQNKAIKY